LTPAFDPKVMSYTASTSNVTNKITATAAKPNTTIAIKVGGAPLANGGTATWETGENVVTVDTANGTTKLTYTVTVTKS